ncbi:MAG TPA: PKD domain-containing protein [Saprospiraceae bacterium]|nr:PKD domain-containing protein [Saprospiraceae bacterium]
MKNLFTLTKLLVFSISLMFVASCEKDDPAPELIAGFSYTVDPADFKKVSFVNASQNYESVSWNFGDNTPVSTEEDPIHTYAQEGVYTVKITATRGSETDDISQQVTISNNDANLAILAGTSTKTWKLLRTTSVGRWPLEVGPFDRSVVWWGLGRDNQDIVIRPCTMNDEWIFNRNGTFEYKTNGDFWAEGGVFEPANVCAESTAANLTGPGGSDLSAFGNGTHAFAFGANQLTVSGLGAFLGLPKIGTDVEVSVPQLSVTYDIIKLSEGTVDTLIVESNYKFAGNTSGADDAYWRVTLVHYDNPASEPPVVGFNADVVQKTVTFTNLSYDATSYSWDFGDGTTSSEANPVHTYTGSGIFTVVLHGTRGSATVETSKDVTISGELSQNDLVGAAWHIRNAANSIFVGPALGDPSWWQVAPEFLNGTSTGGDDWSCMTNDEFIFNANGSYEYKTNGDARNDGYMGTPNGCWTDAEVAASVNGSAFGSATHTWSFTPASGSPSGRPLVTVTNGATGAAFIGFYKGYYGGENGDGANPPNGGNSANQYEVMSYVNDGTTETLVVSVDISADHNNSGAWSIVLVR